MLVVELFKQTAEGAKGELTTARKPDASGKWDSITLGEYLPQGKENLNDCWLAG